MNFNEHLDLVGHHAFLSPSSPYWLDYDDEKLDKKFLNFSAIQRGNDLHALASELIRLRVNLPKSRKTLNLYVNDAIGYRMKTEQPLKYSENCFGTTDAICFRQNILRIHDLKTGETRASMRQLEIYAALFCLEYRVNPFDIKIELRIYQSNEVIVHEPSPEDIKRRMERIIAADKRVEILKAG